MRGVIILLALLFVAANTTVYEQQDTFTVDDTTFTIEHLLEDRTNIRVNNFASLWRVDDCQDTTNHFVCLTQASNTSATIEVREKNTSYTLTRAIPERVVIGEPFRVELTLTNHAPTPRAFSLQEHTTAQTSRHSLIQQDLSWSGTIDAESSRTLAYTATITTPTTFRTHVTEPYEQNNTRTVRVDDFITPTTTYVNQTTTTSTYRFESTLRSDREAEITVVVRAPQLQISRRHNLSAQLTNTFFANQTPYFAFDYSVPQGVRTNITVTVIATTNNSETTRTYTYPVQDAFSPIQLIHDYHDARLPINQEHTLGLTFINPNNHSISAVLRAVSVLINEETTLTIPANGAVEHALRARPNATDSEYAISLTLTYDDINGAKTTTQDTLRIQSTPPHTPPSTNESREQEPPSLRVSAQQTTTGYNLLITPQHLNTTTGLLTIQHFTEIIYNQTIPLNTTYTHPVTTHGTYRATLSTTYTTLTAEHVINQPPSTPSQEIVDEQEVASTHLLLIGSLIVFGLIIVLIGFRAAYLHRRLEHLVKLYETTNAFVTTFTPQTPEDQEKLIALQQELERIQQEIAEHKH